MATNRGGETPAVRTSGAPLFDFGILQVRLDHHTYAPRAVVEVEVLTRTGIFVAPYAPRGFRTPGFYIAPDSARTWVRCAVRG